MATVAAIEALDARFWDLVPADATLEHVAAGFGLTEGPVWRGDHLIFSDVRRDRTVRWQMLPEGPEVRTLYTQTGGGNGQALDADGRIIRCEQGARRLVRVERDDGVTVLAERFEGKRLNSPNDVVVHSSGAIYFTDPPFGLPDHREGKELPFQAVFRLGPDGTLSVATDEVEGPNGLCFSSDERVLYVADTPNLDVIAFDVNADGSLANRRLFADMTSTDTGRPDGLKVDAAGNLYCTGGGGVRIVTPGGEKLGRIRLPEHCRNIAWGDHDLRTLYITAGSGLYRVRLRVAGLAVQPAASAFS